MVAAVGAGTGDSFTKGSSSPAGSSFMSSQSSYFSYRASTGSRRIGRLTTATPTSRPPVLLEFTESALFCGIVGDARPRDVVPLLHTKEPCILDSPSTWYRYLVPILKHAYQRLGLTGGKDRKAIVLFRGYDDTLLPRNVEDALLSALIENIGVPAVNLQCSSLSMVPYSMPMVSDMLVVSVGLSEASCLVHASGENLPFTYQNVPFTKRNTEKEDETTLDEWQQYTFLDSANPHSVIMAVLKSLELCPRTVRKLVISNIVFAGTGLVKQPQIPILVVKQLKAILVAAAAAAATTSPRQRPRATVVATEDQPPSSSFPPESSGTMTIPPSLQTSLVVPISIHSLAGLASAIGLLKHSVRPDLVAWTGATQWAMYWHGQQQQPQDSTTTMQKCTWHTHTTTAHPSQPQQPNHHQTCFF